MLANPQGSIVTGKLLKIARSQDEWMSDVGNPEAYICDVKKAKIAADIFSFRQQLPETKPKFSYYMEWDYLAVIPIKSYDHWLKNQINDGARRAIRKAEKKGVDVKVVQFDDELIRGMVEIFNETPIRQGRFYAHYGKAFEVVKREFSENADNCAFIGAYYKDELIGFIKLGIARQFAVPFGMVAKLEHRDKSPQNAMIAKAVSVCDQRGIAYLLYGLWTEGTLGDFKRNNGCEKMGIPRYYVPLNIKGRIALKLGLHHGITGMLPEGLLEFVKGVRKRFYVKKYGSGGDEKTTGQDG